MYFFFNFSIFLSIFLFIKVNPQKNKKINVCGDENYIQLNKNKQSYELLNTYKAKDYLYWQNLECAYLIEITSENPEFYLYLNLEKNTEISKNVRTKKNSFSTVYILYPDYGNDVYSQISGYLSKIISFKDLKNDKYEVKISHSSIIYVYVDRTRLPFEKYLNMKIKTEKDDEESEESSSSTKISKLVLSLIISSSVVFIVIIIIIICCVIKYLKKKRNEQINVQVQQRNIDVIPNIHNEINNANIQSWQRKLNNKSEKLTLLNGKLFSEIYEKCAIKGKFNECTICIENFKNKSVVVVTPCNHLFHFRCLENWINKKAVDPKCPNCNYKLNS